MWILWALLPTALYVLLLARLRPRDVSGSSPNRAISRKELAFATGAGLLAAVPVCLLERWLARTAGFDPKSHVAGALVPALGSLLLFAPMEEGSKTLVAFRLFKGRNVRTPRRSMYLASALAIGFATFENALYLRDARVSGALVGLGAALVATRALLATVARLFAALFWGYAIGRAVAKGRTDRGLFGMLAGATVLRGLCDHLVFGRGSAALLAALPLDFGMLLVAYFGARELAPRQVPHWDIPLLASVAPPSLAQMRSALRRAERPVMVRWIVAGTFVTIGVVVTAMVVAVMTGRSLGVDFSAVDEGQVTAAIPLLWIGSSTLLAFPFAGFLVARASGAAGVLEPALGSGLAIVSTLVMLGLAAPVAVVFALAFAPVAFALACGGAWMGLAGKP